MTDLQAPSALDDFADRLREAARSRGLNVSELPQLTGRGFSGGSSQSTTLDPGDLPAEARGLHVGRYTLILGTLPDTPTLPVVREVLRRFRNQCVIARSFVSANQSLDLQIFLVGPRGSEWDKNWKSLGLFLERDDRVARKLAWLKPRDALDDDKSFEDFLRRTFFARPWQEDDAKLRDELPLPIEEPSAVGLPRTTAEEFDRIALGGDSDRTADDIVEALVKAWGRRETA